MDAKRVIEIILEEAAKTEERFPGYREEIAQSVAQIVLIEKQHKFASKNVKQEIADQINLLGAELAKKQNRGKK